MSKTTNKYLPEVRERAVRMVLDNEGQHELGRSGAQGGRRISGDSDSNADDRR